MQLYPHHLNMADATTNPENLLPQVKFRVIWVLLQEAEGSAGGPRSVCMHQHGVIGRWTAHC